MAGSDPDPHVSRDEHFKLTLTIRAQASRDPTATLSRLFAADADGCWRIRASGLGAAGKIPPDLILDSYRWQRQGGGVLRLEIWAYALETWLRRRRLEARPVEIDGDLVIKPAWDRRRFPGKTVIKVDAGLAFGTGSHPSTRLCLMALKKFLVPGGRVLDCGCGSGILAVAAARLGARSVTATDVDPLALLIAQQNARRNRVVGRVKVVAGGPDRLRRVPYDLIVANLNLGLHEQTAATLGRLLAPAGLLVCSGIRAKGAHHLRALQAAEGRRMRGMFSSGEWRALVFGHA